MKQPSFLLLAALLGAAGIAQAQEAGRWSASVGITKLTPAVDSGDLSAPAFVNTKVSIDGNTQLTGALNYAYTDNIVAHLPLGFGFKHKVSGAGGIAGVGVIATTKALPVTLIGQYRFLPANAVFRPYAGAGLTYANFYDETGTGTLTALTNPGGSATTVRFNNKLAPTFQLGGTYNLNAKWYVDASYTKTLLKTRGNLSTGQHIDVTLNPSGYTLQVGYKF
jgi:outer membrane protein